MRRRHLRIGAKTLDIIKEAVVTSGDLLTAMQRPSLGMRMGIHLAQDYLDERRWATKRRSLHRLAKSGYLIAKETADGLAYVLSEKGAVEYLRTLVHDADMMGGDEVCMVIFDIPEKFRSVRRDLYAFLTDAGFLPHQKSVFISPYNAFEPLAELFALKGADQWVKVYRATRVTLSGRSALKRHKR